MIRRDKIEKLTEDEFVVLGYIINDSLPERVVTSDQFYLLQPQWLFVTLNEYAYKIKDEHKPMVQSIADKLLN